MHGLQLSRGKEAAARSDRWPDAGRALGELLARWDKGMVTGRRERRMAVRLAAERTALPDLAEHDLAGQVAYLPGMAGPGTGPPPGETAGRAVPGADGDDDDPAEIFDAPGDGDFYADAFEVLE